MKTRAECMRRCVDKCCFCNIRWLNIGRRTDPYLRWDRHVIDLAERLRVRPLILPNSCSPQNRCATASHVEDHPFLEIRDHLERQISIGHYYIKYILSIGILVYTVCFLSLKDYDEPPEINVLN